MTTRHEFLAQLHEILQPQSYLEVGVQHGWSLELSKAPISFGIDPYPYVDWPNVIRGESDTVWADKDLLSQLYPSGIDLGFIDGMHQFEYALRDLMGMERLAHARTMIVFDDVLPRNQREAARTQCPGDWTGDVWKIVPAVSLFRPDLVFRLVDTQPTGLLLVTGFGRTFPEGSAVPGILERVYESLIKLWAQEAPVPDDVLNRTNAWQPDRALEEVRTWMQGLEEA